MSNREQLLKASDPVPRPSTPAHIAYNSQNTKQAIKHLAQGQLYPHSIATRKMVSNTVNKTALHPAGVQYVPIIIIVLEYNSLTTRLLQACS